LGRGTAPEQTTWSARAAVFRSAGLFAAAALIPFLIFGGVSAYRSLEAEHAQAETQAVDDARLLSAITDQELSKTLDEVQTLADSPTLDHPGAYPGFAELAARTLADHPLWRDVILIDPKTNTRVFESPGPLRPQLQAPSLLEAERTLKPAIGDIRKREVWGIPVRAPVIRDGKLVYVATVVIRPERIQNLINALHTPPNWIVSIVNQNGHVIARSRLVDRYLGAPANEPALEARARGGGGLYSGFTLEHTPTISAYWVSRQTGWSVHIGIPRAEFESRLRRSGLVLALMLAASVVLGGFFLVLFLRELETRRAQAAALEQAARLEALGRLTGGVAHDFNNLLTVIQGNVAILRRKLKEPVAEPHLDAIRQAGEQAVKLIRQLLVFARGGVSQTAAVDLEAAVEASLLAVRQVVGAQVAVTARRSGGPALAQADPIQLEAAILNLAANARDAMPAGGTLEFATRLDGGFVELSVSDTGQGVPPEILPRVFDPFFTTKAVGKGTGLGLAQVYGMARSAGGAARIESAVGRGTTVILRLPRAEGEPERATPGPDPAHGEVRGPRILLVDDDARVRETLASYLRGSGLHVREARDAAEALAVLGAERFDALVSDIVMPGEMDGLALAKAAKRHDPELPVLLVSGFGASVDDAAAAGFTVLAKPVDLADLEQRLRAVSRALAKAG
jgi:signal transduction histidine kinase